MNARRVIIIFATFALLLSATALWDASGDERDGDTAANVVAASGAEAGPDADAAPKKKGGGLFGKILKAPFKAVGRLIGRGGDEGKLARMTERDGERFESVGVVRVEDRDNARPSVPDEGGSARDYLERGRALLEGGRLNEAVAELSRAASLDPKLSQAHSLLAVAYDRKGLHDRAEDSYRRAIGVNERDPDALNNLGYSLYLSGNYRAAVDKLKRAARLAPADSRVLNNLALAQVRLGKYDDAYRN
ncbi:MAG TPA: tetratricopeptide repeat protein, partial [Pyrinomonadaceae bacterium]